MVGWAGIERYKAGLLDSPTETTAQNRRALDSSRIPKKFSPGEKPQTLDVYVAQQREKKIKFNLDLISYHNINKYNK